MNRRIGLLAVAALAALSLRPEPAPAWEAATTHAGITEQAALSSVLHERLEKQLGLELGIYQPLVIPPEDAAALYELLRLLNPTHGYVPDARGKLLALGWLSAGSVIADTPDSHAANHFFDPLTGEGLSDQTIRGMGTKLRRTFLERISGEGVESSGMAATEWINDAANPMSVAGFLSQYGKAMRASTPAERERHVAGALLAAGALLHVLQDMGVPSHVRNDLAAHVDEVGNDALDLGSRFERVAALAYGRLGVPGPDGIYSADSIANFFTAPDGSGLADTTSVHWFSAYTLPRSFEFNAGMKTDALQRELADSLRRPHPAPLPQLDLIGARRSEAGATLVDGQGTCLARYMIEDGRMSWNTDDECRLEQIAQILPQVAGYSTGLLDYLFRGELEVAVKDGQLAITGRGESYGAGTLEVLWDDSRGVRTAIGDAQSVAGGDEGSVLGTAALPPKGARKVAVVFTGVDKSGQPLVAAGTTSYPIKAKKK